MACARDGQGYAGLCCFNDMKLVQAQARLRHLMMEFVHGLRVSVPASQGTSRMGYRHIQC